MERVLLVTQDQHLVSQVKSWLAELPAKTNLIVTDDFQAWCQSPEGLLAAAAALQSSNGKSEKPEVDSGPPGLVILDHPTSFQTKHGWVNELKDALCPRGPDGSSTCTIQPLFLLLIPHSPLLDPEHFIHSGADDLALKPLDRAVILQKIEVLLARGKPVTPSFLYRLKTDHEVEIAKNCVIEEISEVEIFIRNPVPVKPGIYANLHSEILGEGEESRVDVVVLDSLPIAGEKNIWRVHLRFFGLTSRQLTKVRYAMKKLPVSRQPTATLKSSRVSVERPTSVKTPVAPTHLRPLPAQASRPFRLAILDLDPQTERLFQSALGEATINLKLLSYPGPSRLLASWLSLIEPQPAPAVTPPTKAPVKTPTPAASAKPGGAAASEEGVIDLAEMAGTAKPAPPPPPPFFPSAGGAKFVVQASDGEIVHFETKLADKAVLLGYDREQWSTKPSLLVDVVIPADREMYREMLEFTALSGKGEVRLHLRAHDDRVALVQIKAERSKAAVGDQSAHITLNLTEAPATATSPGSLSGPTPTVKKLNPNDLQVDALVVEAAFLASDPEGRVRLLRETYVRAGLARSLEEAPPIFIVADERTDIQPRDYRVEGVAHFAWKIPDRRHLLETFLTFAPPTIWREEGLAPRRTQCHIDGHLARESRISQISEFGLIVHDVIPFKKGAFLRFFSEVLGQHEHGVLARCVSTNKTDSGWDSEFVFFGPSEDFQKHIRMHVRSEYARKKSRESA